MPEETRTGPTNTVDGKYPLSVLRKPGALSGPIAMPDTGSGTDSPTLRTFRLLQFIAEGGETSNLSELSRKTGINRATVVRLLADLEAAGAIDRGTGGGHRPGLQLMKLAATSLNGQDMPGLGRLVIERLSSQLGLTVYLAIGEGRYVLYLLRQVPRTPLVSNISIGSLIPAHLTTPGRVLLAHYNDEELEDLLGGESLERSTSQSPATIADLRQLLEVVRSNGFAWSESGFEAGISSCAAPVFDRDGQAVAAISAVGPTDALDPRHDPQIKANVEQAVVAAAKDLSELLLGIQ